MYSNGGGDMHSVSTTQWRIRVDDGVGTDNVADDIAFQPNGIDEMLNDRELAEDFSVVHLEETAIDNPP